VGVIIFSQLYETEVQRQAKKSEKLRKESENCLDCVLEAWKPCCLGGGSLGLAVYAIISTDSALWVPAGALVVIIISQGRPEVCPFDLLLACMLLH